MITAPQDFFDRGCGRCPRFATADCSAKLWLPGLLALREILLAEGLEETAKWGHPVYRHAGRNLALIGAFRDSFRLTFFEAGLLSDPDRLLTRSGPNTRFPDGLRFDAPEQVAPLRAGIAALVAEAKTHAEAGRRAPRATGTPDLPEDLGAALDADPALAEAFAALTPGRQRSHVLALASAKAPETRLRRIAALTPRILAGKGATER